MALSPTVLLLVLGALCIVSLDASPLSDLYKRVMKKQDDIINERLQAIIRENVPQGVQASNPKIAEYETFKQSPEANFIHDGYGRIQFREFRRINLNNVMGRQMPLATSFGL